MKEAQSAIRLLLGVTISQLNLKIMLTELSTMGLVCLMPNNAIEHLMVQATRTWRGEVQVSITKHVQGWANEKSVSTVSLYLQVITRAGHYTAMVWQNTQEIGCGFASPDQMNFLVCRYNPPGKLYWGNAVWRF